MLRVLAVLGVAVAACGPSRDPFFHRIVEFSAVEKLLVSDDGFVYFIEKSSLERVAITGGDIEEVLPGHVSSDFALAPGLVFAATASGLTRVRTDGGKLGTSSKLSTEPARAVAADGSGVTWLTCDRLTHAALDGIGAVATPVAGPCMGDVALALDSSTAYGITGSGPWYAARSGGPVHGISSQACERIVAGGGWLYCGTPQGLYRIDPLHGDQQLLLEGEVHDFALSPSHLYAAVGADLLSLPRNGGPSEVLGTYAAISAVALDDADVFFVNTDKGFGLLLRTAQ